VFTPKPKHPTTNIQNFTRKNTEVKDKERATMKKTLSHFLNMAEYEAYLLGWKHGVAHATKDQPALDSENANDVLKANDAEQQRIKKLSFIEYMNDGYGGMGEGDEGVPFNNQDQQP
jgi:hypothetical protein